MAWRTLLSVTRGGEDFEIAESTLPFVTPRMVLPGLRPAPLSVMKRLSVKIMKMTVTMTTTVPHLLYTYFVPRIVINTFEPYLNSPHGPMGLLLLSSEEETETQRCWVIIPGSNYC